MVRWTVQIFATMANEFMWKCVSGVIHRECTNVIERNEGITQMGMIQN